MPVSPQRVSVFWALCSGSAVAGRKRPHTKAFLPAVPSAAFSLLLLWLCIDLNREKAGGGERRATMGTRGGLKQRGKGKRAEQQGGRKRGEAGRE